MGARGLEARLPRPLRRADRCAGRRHGARWVSGVRGQQQQQQRQRQCWEWGLELVVVWVGSGEVDGGW